MNNEVLFQLVGAIATLGWLCIIIASFLPATHIRRSRLLLIGGRTIPLLLAAIYLTLLLSSLGSAPADGNFMTLAGVATLFSVPGLLLAGWVHYLAFDLFIGRWIVDDADALGIKPLLRLPFLLLTFWLGPIGLLSWFILRALRKNQ